MNSELAYEMHEKISTPSTKKAVTFLQKEYPDIDICGSGTARIIIDDGDRVYKIAVSFNAIRQNENEVKLWNLVSNRNLLAEVYDYGDGYEWVCMEKVTNVVTDESLFPLDIYKEISTQIMEDYEDVSIHEAEGGINSDGVVVLCDYGEAKIIES